MSGEQACERTLHLILHLRRLWDWTKLLLLFVVLTLISYMLIGVLTDWLKPSYRFQEPTGRAIKVFSTGESGGRLYNGNDWERIKLYFQIGE